MFDLLFENTSLPVLEQVMAFSELRQQVLAHNVANINTPGFRQTDLPVGQFTEALDEAIRRRDGETPHRFKVRSTRDIEFGPRLKARSRPINGLMNYYDGSDRSIDHLQNEMLKNAIWHEAAAKLFAHQAEQLETAIRERLQ